MLLQTASFIWLAVSCHSKNMSEIGSFPQARWKWKLFETTIPQNGIFTYIYQQNYPNAGKTWYSFHPLSIRLGRILEYRPPSDSEMLTSLKTRKVVERNPWLLPPAWQSNTTVFFQTPAGSTANINEDRVFMCFLLLFFRTFPWLI